MSAATADRHLDYVPLADVAPAARNAKAHDRAAIAASIAAFGFTAPVVVDERTGRLVAGHGRLSALHALQDAGERPPDGVQDRDGTWLVPVVRGWASADDAHAEALLIADNKLTEAGGWDDTALRELLTDVAQHSSDLLALTGFDSEDLERLIAGTTGAGMDGDGGTAAADLDDLPEPADPAAQLDDLWLLGTHRLAVGDSRNHALVERLMDGHRAQCMWTDPPRAEVGAEDTVTDLVTAALGPAAAALRPGAPAYLIHGHGLSLGVGAALVGAGWSLRQQLLWVKDRAEPTTGHYQYRHEPIWLAYTPAKDKQGRLGRGGPQWYGGDNQSTVFEIAAPDRADLHPAAKPVALVAAMLTNSAARGQRVYDPFGGSGSTLIACQSLGMTAHVVELEPRFADMTIRRWQALTGNTATRAGDGATYTEVSAAL